LIAYSYGAVNAPVARVDERTDPVHIPFLAAGGAPVIFPEVEFVPFHTTG
jgi:hypothetical protein